MSVSELLTLLGPTLDEADGITVTGGEPFDQPEALKQLLRGIRTRTRADVLVYSGYPFEALESSLRAMEGLVDGLVSDPFERETPQTLALRGSDNQRLRPLTALGQERFAAFERTLGPGDHALDAMFDDATGEVFFVGIPRRGDMRRLTALLAKDGHAASTTEDKCPSP
jgi:anaerobic ribonucleoside-triphosphate reductase activating protein